MNRIQAGLLTRQEIFRDWPDRRRRRRLALAIALELVGYFALLVFGGWQILAAVFLIQVSHNYSLHPE